MCKKVTIATVILSTVFWASGCYTKIGYPPPDYSVDQTERKRSVEEERDVDEEAYSPTRYRGYEKPLRLSTSFRGLYEEYYYTDYFYPIFYLPRYSYRDYYHYPYRCSGGSLLLPLRHHRYYHWYDDGVKVKKRKQYTRGTIRGRRK